MSARGRREPLLQRGQELIEPYVSLQSLPALTRLHEIESLFDLGLFSKSRRAHGGDMAQSTAQLAMSRGG
jgi:hypothetical protein